MQEREIIPDFVRKLYALNSKRTNDDGSVKHLVEDTDDGSVTESDEEAFVYNIDRKTEGIEGLYELLTQKGLVLDVIDEIKIANKVHKVFPRIVVKRSSEVDFYKDLSLEQKTAFNELINTHALRDKRHCVKAFVKGDLAGMEAAKALDITEAAEVLADADEVAKEELDLEIKYLQMQLDLIFEPAVEMKSDLSKIHSVIVKFKDGKKLLDSEEKLLLAFIEHTYGSIESFLAGVNPEDPFLLAIHNEFLGDLDKDRISEIYYKVTATRTVDLVIAKDVKKLSADDKILLARQLKKFGIDLNKTKKEDFKDEALALFRSIEGKIEELKKVLKQESYTISKSDVKDFGKVFVSRNILGNIAENHDLENSFRMLDGRHASFSTRLRVCHDDPETVISAINQKFLWEYGLESAEKISGVSLKDLEPNLSGKSSEVSLKQQFSPHKSFLTASREYDESLMLEEGHVIAITKKLLEKQGIDNTSIRFISVSPENEYDRENAVSSKKNALIEAAKGKPVALQISNRDHWITVCLLPVIEEDGSIKKIEVVSMDSIGICALGKGLVPDLKELGEKIGLEVSDLHNMSVTDQQKVMCCGFATAVNGFAILKTYRDLKGKLPVKDDGSFDLEEFNKSLLPNVLYRKEKGQTILYGNKTAPNLSTLDFVRQFGGLILQEVASKESAQELLAKGQVEELKKLDSCQVTLELKESYFVADSRLLHEVLSGKKAVTEDSEVPEGHQRVKLNKKFYDVPRADYQRISDVEYWKGLDSILNGGPLDDILSNEKTRGLFVKLLKDSFKNGNNPHTKDFDKTARILSKIIHVDDEIKAKINAAIQEAQGNNPDVKLGWVDAILLFLYNLPIIGRLVAMSGADIVKVAVTIDRLESKTQSWGKYASSGLNQTIQDLIPTA